MSKFRSLMFANATERVNVKLKPFIICSSVQLCQPRTTAVHFMQSVLRDLFETLKDCFVRQLYQVLETITELILSSQWHPCISAKSDEYPRRKLRNRLQNTSKKQISAHTTQSRSNIAFPLSRTICCSTVTEF